MSFTKKDWNGITVLLVLIAIALAAPYVYQWYSKDNTLNPKEFDAAIARLNKAGVMPIVKDNPDRRNVTLHKFDPNTVKADQWQQMGLTDKQARIIVNYISKGGKFRKPEDLKKIYSLADTDYVRLAPYVQIAQEQVKPNAIVELNTADSSKLMLIDGIGPAFAKRIISYRERLGGFVNREQLKEVFGFDDLKYKEIAPQVKVNEKLIRKIPINSISFDKLRLMPYLNYKQVNALIEYRKQHGDYHNLTDLRSIAIIDEQIFRKIEPYIIFDDTAAN